MSNIDLAREYDNRAKVADFAAIVAGWARAAESFRGRAGGELSLRYGPGPRQELDLFLPPGMDTAGAPAALFLHGGYWQAMDRGYFSHLAGGLLAHGVAVAMPSYDLCPTVSLETIIEQARQAAGFVHRRTGRRLLAMGHSAGGHLSACLLATDWASRGLPADLVPAALSLSGLFDLLPLRQVKEGAALGLDEATARRLSPVFWPRPSGRIHAVVGGEEGEEYLRQSREIAAAWGGTWDAVPGANHFSVIAPLAEPGSTLVAEALALLPLV
jgi:arylformamidase